MVELAGEHLRFLCGAVPQDGDRGGERVDGGEAGGAGLVREDGPVSVLLNQVSVER